MPLESHHSTGELEATGQEAIDRLVTFWNRHGRVVLGVAGVVAAVGALLFFNQRTRAAAEDEAAARLAEANVLYWQGDYTRSLELAKQVSTQYGSAPSGIEAHRLAGDNAYWTGDFKTAIAEYRRYLDKNKDGLLADAGRRSLAYGLESDQQYQEAAKLYEQLVGVLDRNSSAEFLAAAARCYRLMGQPQVAIQRLKRITEEFGETPYAQPAWIEMAELSATAR